MRGAVAITAALAVAACGATTATGPKGRAVRVERGHGEVHHTPRICQVMTSSRGE